MLSILYDYSTNNELFSKDAIIKILEMSLTENNLQNTISYEISNDDIFDISNLWNKNLLAMFDMDAIIYIYYHEILKSINKKKYLSKYDGNLTDIELTFKKNIMILETIIHEVEHANQLMHIRNIYDGSIETQLYRYEYDYMYPSEDINLFSYYMRSLTYQIYYHLSFMERMANIISYEKTAHILSELDNKYQRLYESETKILDDFIIKEYQQNPHGPTIRFMNNLGFSHEFRECGYDRMINNMSFDERLRYGFMITEEEYKKVKK